MSLFVLAVGLGSTTRPLGVRKSTPQLVGSTVVENEGDSSSAEEPLLRSLSEAPVTNNRFADNDMREFYEYLLKQMEEDATHKASLGPWD